jgi:periplasmic nitrate reductase NapD
MSPDEVHISSLIVQAMPDTMPAVNASVSAMPGLEVHAVEAGKMVVVLETADEGEIVARLSEINLLDGVMSVNLVYHQVDRVDEFNETGEGQS